MKAAHGRDDASQAIREDIERTRARMGETVETLGERLNVGRLKQELKSNVREATIGRVEDMANNAKERVISGGRGLASTVRENPIPAAMIAGGIGWLLLGRRHGGHREARTEPVSGTMRTAAPAPASDLGYEPRWSEDEGRAHQLADQARERVDEARERVGNMAHEAREQTMRMGSGVVDSYESNPIAIGAVAAAVGIAVGLSMPATDREARVMGAKRDQLVDRARESVSGAGEKVKHAAQRAIPEVKETLKDVARDEGLPTP